MHHLVFTLLSVFSVACALGVVASRNTVNGALCLLACLIGIAGLFIGLQAYFLAFLLILVYAGAVVAFFLFIVMLLDIRGGHARRFQPLPLAAAFTGLALLLAGLDVLALRSPFDVPHPSGPGVGSSLKPFGVELFTTYLLPVEVLGFLLLAAMLGVIVLSRKQPDEPVEGQR